MLPAQRGDVSNSAEVITRLAGREAMFVFLRDSTRVVSRPASSGATLEMKLRLR